MVGGSLRVLRLLPPLKLVINMTDGTVGVSWYNGKKLISGEEFSI
jgi:hypothetical protein